MKCFLCNKKFIKKFNMSRHLINKACKEIDYVLINEQLEQLDQLKQSKKLKQLDIIIHNHITNLNTQYIEPEKMKLIVEEYDINPHKLNILLSSYIKNIIHNKEHPENHAVKYIKRHPPIYNVFFKDTNGNIKNVINIQNDTCELLVDPILNQLKTKLNQFVKKYKTSVDFDYNIYEDTINELRNELNTLTIKKAIISVLQCILNDTEMKYKNHF